jgi:hypothetical protein
LQILQGINQKYSILFGGTSGGVGGQVTYSFREKWGWIANINDMCNNDRTKWDYFFNMNVIEFLNTVSFYIDKSESDREIERARNV